MVLDELMGEFYDISENQTNKTLIHNNRRDGGDSLVNYSREFYGLFCYFSFILIYYLPKKPQSL